MPVQSAQQNTSRLLPADRSAQAIAIHTPLAVSEAAAPRPFLKWAGGKGQLLPALLERVPRSIDTYYEPFLGGGALFFALSARPELAPRRAVLNDLNDELMTTYEVVRDRVDDLVEQLAGLQDRYLAVADGDRAAIYYDVRDEEPDDAVELAARLIFLNKTCFNGLYRVNRAGRFNVPHGRYRRPRILDEDALRAASCALQRADLLRGDFVEACADAREGDFVYFDPPFHPLSQTASFTGYTEEAFDREEQLRLKAAIDGLVDRGVATMLSNSPHDWVLGVYQGALRYRVETTPARRAINSRADRRGAIDELLVTTYPSGLMRGRLELP